MWIIQVRNTYFLDGTMRDGSGVHPAKRSLMVVFLCFISLHPSCVSELGLFWGWGLLDILYVKVFSRCKYTVFSTNLPCYILTTFMQLEKTSWSSTSFGLWSRMSPLKRDFRAHQPSHFHPSKEAVSVFLSLFFFGGGAWMRTMEGHSRQGPTLSWDTFPSNSVNLEFISA